MPYEGKAGVPGIVIVGFILAFLCPLVGLVLCVIGMGEATRRGEGVKLAKAGLVISVVLLVLSIVLWAAGVRPPAR